jgi:tetratricopeptide (TPR) repeat protein
MVDLNGLSDSRKVSNLLDKEITEAKKRLNTLATCEDYYRVGQLYFARALYIQANTREWDSTVQYGYKDAIPYLQKAQELNPDFDYMDLLKTAEKGKDQFV